MAESEHYPEYPALSKCLILESRHSLRSEVVKSINASTLFNEIVLAESVLDGLSKIKRAEFDACIVGSSVSPDIADDFIERAEIETKSDDCAFIVLEDESVIAAKGSYTFRKAKPDGRFSFPCTKQKFTDGIVKSIVNANANSPWKAIYTKYQNEDVSSDGKPGAAASILGDSFSALEEIVEGVNMGIYRLDDDGNPSPRTAEALDKVFSQLFKIETTSKSVLNFATFFRMSLDQWFVDYLVKDQDTANSTLKKKLFDYMKLQSNKESRNN